MIPTFLDNAFLKNKACRLKYKITKSKKKETGIFNTKNQMLYENTQYICLLNIHMKDAFLACVFIIDFFNVT